MIERINMIAFTSLFMVVFSPLAYGMELQEVRVAVPECSTTEVIQEISSLKDYVRDRELDKFKKFRKKLLTLQLQGQKDVFLELNAELPTIKNLARENKDVAERVKLKTMAHTSFCSLCTMIVPGILAISGAAIHDKNVLWGGIGAVVATGATIVGGTIINALTPTTENQVYIEICRLQKIEDSLDQNKNAHE